MQPDRSNIADQNKTQRGWLLALLPVILVSACNWGYGEPVDRAKFGSAALHEDSARCVFALHDAVYRPAEGMRAFPDGGIPRYVVDRHKIGIFDVHNDEVDILIDSKNRDWLDGHGGYHVSGLLGNWALIRQSGQRPDYEHDHRWMRLDLNDEELTTLPLDEEMAAHNRSIARVEIADEDFTLIIVTKKDRAPQEIWSRPAGEPLRRLTATDHYYGVANGEIWWYDVVARAGARTDYETGRTTRERRADFAIPRENPTSKCQASFDGSSLLYQHKAGETWRERVLPIRAATYR